MVNTPKSKDPADAVLSAVEEALRIDPAASTAEHNREGPQSGPRDRRLEMPRINEPLRATSQAPNQPPRRADSPAARKADAPQAAPRAAAKAEAPAAQAASDEAAPRQRRFER